MVETVALKRSLCHLPGSVHCMLPSTCASPLGNPPRFDAAAFCCWHLQLPLQRPPHQRQGV